jgi:CRP/FNR family cyclic AMP-dependent transcriptional regulator
MLWRPGAREASGARRLKLRHLVVTIFARRSVSGATMNEKLIDMRQFAKSAGTNILVKAGNDVFHRGDPGACMYIVQSGVIEMVIGDKVIETVSANEAIGFMSMIDTHPRSSTARVKEDSELSVIDQRTFRFMVDEVPNFAMYIMGVLARRIRGMSQVMR